MMNATAYSMPKTIAGARTGRKSYQLTREDKFWLAVALPSKRSLLKTQMLTDWGVGAVRVDRHG